MKKLKPKYLAYVGTTKVAFLEARSSSPTDVEVIALSAKLAKGFHDGFVQNLDHASQTLSEAVHEVAGQSAKEGLSCRLVVSNAHLKTHTFQSSIYFNGNPHPITLRDVREVIAQTRSVATIPLQEVIVQVVPQEFLVNDLAGVQSPFGLEATRLGATLKLLTLDYLDYSNLAKVFEYCDLEVDEVIPSVLSAAHAVLYPEEQQGGVMLVVLGGTVTHLACYKNSVLVDLQTIPIGGDCITGVIARHLNVDHLDAQRIKEKFGSVVSKAEFQDELIPVPDLNGQKRFHMKRREFESHLQAGLGLFFKEIEREIALLRKRWSPLNRFVFTGGAAQMDGFLERMEESLGPMVRIGTPIGVKGPQALMANPAFSSAIGGIHYTSQIRYGSGSSQVEEEHWLVRGIQSARNWIFEHF